MDTRSVSNSSMNCTSCQLGSSGSPQLEPTCSFNTLTFIPAYLRYSSSILLSAHRWSLR